MGRAEGKTSHQSRDCPADFDVVFVEKGRVECESWYRCARKTITRWLAERGKARLIKARAAFVKHQRSIDRGKRPAPIVKSKRQIDDCTRKLAIAAGRWLQSPRGGNWVVYPMDDGSIMVGTKSRAPREVVELAVAKGFDRIRAIEQIKAFGEPI